jgi:hypothetical protein
VSRACVALIALVVAAAFFGCGADQQQPSTITVETAPAPEATPAAAEIEPSRAEPAATADPPAQKPSGLFDTPPGVYPVIWVRAGQEVAMRTEPGGGELVARVGRRSEFGSPSVFGVIEHRGEWVGVTTQLLPNNDLGWIRLDRGRVENGWSTFSIVVDLSERRTTLLEAGERKLSFPVTIGAPGTDTPTGRFAITDTFTGLDSAAYGCCALALSATQPNLPSGWLGGRRIAIHGTAGALGIAASHGCVRAANADVLALVHRVPLGTPVFIRA